MVEAADGSEGRERWEQPGGGRDGRPDLFEDELID